MKSTQRVLFCAYDIQETAMAIKIAPEPKPKPKPKVTVAEFMEELSTRKPRTGQNKRGRPSSGKVRITILLKPKTIAKFKAAGKGWQSRMSDVLDKAAC
jgi:uncharacterized protein (DUF4415 family)